MVPNPGETIPVNGQNLVLMYPRATPHVDSSEWTVEHALNIVGVPNNQQGAIMGDKSPNGIGIV